MNTKAERIMKMIIVLLLITIFILIFMIIHYKNTPKQTFGIEDYDFTDEIRNINYNMTKDDIYAIEGREEDLTNYNMNLEILIFNNAKVDNYTGVLRYYLEENRLISIQFEFRDKDDYNSYLKSFRSKYSDGRLLTNNTWNWDGHIENCEVLYTAYDLYNTIEKGEYQ